MASFLKIRRRPRKTHRALREVNEVLFKTLLNVTRRLIELTCDMIGKLIREGGSRLACQGLANKLDYMLAATERLNLLLVDPGDAEEFQRQVTVQLNLFAVIEAVKENVDDYVLSRADDLLQLDLSTCRLSAAGQRYIIRHCQHCHQHCR